MKNIFLISCMILFSFSFSVASELGDSNLFYAESEQYEPKLNAITAYSGMWCNISKNKEDKKINISKSGMLGYGNSEYKHLAYINNNEICVYVEVKENQNKECLFLGHVQDGNLHIRTKNSESNGTSTDIFKRCNEGDDGSLAV